MEEKRSALRIALNVPVVIESIGVPDMTLHPNVQAVFERVTPGLQYFGESFPAAVRDISTNGAFIAGTPLPLLSRVRATFTLDGYGEVKAVGWSLWRRSDDCQVPRADGGTASLPKGFGILFEAIPLDVRLFIHKAVDAQT